MTNLYQIIFSVRYYDDHDVCLDSNLHQVFCAASSMSDAKELAYHFLKEQISLGDKSSIDLVCTSARLIYSSYFIY